MLIQHKIETDWNANDRMSEQLHQIDRTTTTKISFHSISFDFLLKCAPFIDNNTDYNNGYTPNRSYFQCANKQQQMKSKSN